MPNAKCGVDEFINLCNELGSPSLVGEKLHTGMREVQGRYNRMKNSEKYRDKLKPWWNLQSNAWLSHYVRTYAKAYPALLRLEVTNSTFAVISDLHIVPGFESTAQRGFLSFLENEKCDGVILNGDIFEFAQISRHPRIGWQHRSTVINEIEHAAEWTGKVEKLCKGKHKIRTPGNHCLRLEGYISNKVPELEGMPGSKLKYYLPNWECAWAIRFNTDSLHVTHRMRGGVHAPYNNAREGLMSTCTGHLHSQKVMPHTGFDRTIWGVDCGTGAEPGLEEDWPQFEYTEGRSRDWRAGWAVFTWKNGVLMPPELAQVIGPGQIWFRGTLHQV